MTLFSVIILGIVQGIAEFLPISSSGHLAIVRSFFHIKDNVMTIDVAFHFGTLLSLLIFYRKDIFKLLKTKKNTSLSLDNYLILILIGITPAAITGVVFGEWFESYFVNPNYFFLFITGCFLFSLKLVPDNSHKNLNWHKALFIGILQIFALLPGISRAGITITTALHLKIDRKESANFSFLMAIPLLLGASILKLKILFTFPSSQIKLLLIGVSISFVFGLLALKLVMQSLTHKKFHLFSWYCWSIAILGWLFL